MTVKKFWSLLYISFSLISCYKTNILLFFWGGLKARGEDMRCKIERCGASVGKKVVGMRGTKLLETAAFMNKTGKQL